MKVKLDTPPAGRSTLRRQEVLDAALVCFAEKGIAGTVIEDIRNRSGASIGSLYHQFGSKGGVAAALYLDAMKDFQFAVVRRLRPDTAAQAGLRLLIGNHIDWVEKNEARARFLHEARHTETIEAHAAKIQACNREFAARIGDWVRARLEAGELRRLPVDLFIAQLLGPTHEYARGRLSGRESTAPRQAKDILAESAWRGLGIDVTSPPRRKGKP